MATHVLVKLGKKRVDKYEVELWVVIDYLRGVGLVGLRRLDLALDNTYRNR